MSTPFAITVCLIIFVLYVWQLVKIYRDRQAYKDRDPDDRQWWSSDQWAEHYADGKDY